MALRERRGADRTGPPVPPRELLREGAGQSLKLEPAGSEVGANPYAELRQGSARKGGSARAAVCAGMRGCEHLYLCTCVCACAGICAF